MRKLCRSAALGAALLASGCAGMGGNHVLTLMGADGTVGTGTATRGSSRGTIQVDLDRTVYTGTWIAGRGGSLGYGSVGAAPFTNVSMSTSSAGNAMLRAADGGTLRCNFTYDGVGHVGFGECMDRARKHYDLQIE